MTVAAVDVLVVGDLNPDLLVTGDVVPRFGQAEQLLDSAQLLIGGSAGITAHGLAVLGRRVRLCAAVGTDPFGDRVLQQLAARGVDTSAVLRRDDIGTGLTMVLAAAERAILTYLGAIASLTSADVRAAIERAHADGARHVHVCAYFLLQPLAAELATVLAGARELGMTTSLDTNFDPSHRWHFDPALLAQLDYLLPNAVEARALAATLTGGPVDDLVRAGQILAARGPNVVIKDGANGTCEFSPGSSPARAAAECSLRRQAAYPVVPLDTTGAGDTFNAAYLDGLLAALPPELRLRRASLAGALSTLALGGTAGQPDSDQLRDRALTEDVR
ncbi:carbohydrate kinase family protein [Jatrophihabitans telluris]|uniref:Carbohydrate kinase family protein n=1 Tax=Jatrophihabitans telluris TaxID=2038343 RepID=A0ABY4R621_9ACTN|nr:carbohydrate kinase family protein [Jatrophihabitans telluris]UQX90271.1 carbohydrate kinase family protein [Jatrophihabitans telluris]